MISNTYGCVTPDLGCGAGLCVCGVCVCVHMTYPLKKDSIYLENDALRNIEVICFCVLWRASIMFVPTLWSQVML